MLPWRTRPGLYKPPFQQFLEAGGPPPKDVAQVARYPVPGSVLGWHVLETNDMTALRPAWNNWTDLIHLELNPLVEDTQCRRSRGPGVRHISSPSRRAGWINACTLRAGILTRTLRRRNRTGIQISDDVPLLVRRPSTANATTDGRGQSSSGVRRSSAFPARTPSSLPQRPTSRLPRYTAAARHIREALP